MHRSCAARAAALLRFPFSSLAVALVAAACGAASPSAGTSLAVPARARHAPPLAAERPEAPPTAEQVLAAYVDATGGRAARDGLVAMRMHGTFTIEKLGISGPMDVIMEAPGRARTTIDLGRLGRQEQGCDGDVAWQKSESGVRILSGAERDRALRTSTIHNELLWRQLYKSVVLVGDAQIDGRPAWKLALTSPDGEIEHRYFDKQSHLEVASERTITTERGAVAALNRVVAYGQFGPVRMPKTIRQTMQTGLEITIAVQDVEWNPPLPPEAFQPPPARAQGMRQ